MAIKTKARQIATHEQATFDFCLDTDREHVYRLPLFQHLPVKAVRELGRRGDNEEDAAVKVDIIFDLFDRYAPGLTDEITQADVQAILDAWSEASEVSLGE